MFIKNAQGRFILVSLQSFLNHLKNIIPLHIEGVNIMNIKNDTNELNIGNRANP